MRLSGEIPLIPKPKDHVEELRKWGEKLEFRNMGERDIGTLAEEEAFKVVENRKNRRERKRMKCLTQIQNSSLQFAIQMIG